MAFETYAHASSQVRLLREDCKRQNIVVVLDFAATERVMRLLDVPRSTRLRVWQSVQYLHDLEYHDGRDHRKSPLYCYHAQDPLLDIDLDNCARCRARYYCRHCDERGVWHPTCGE